MKAYVEVNNLKIRACHGVLPQERAVGNLFEVSLRLEYPPAIEAMDSDNLDSTINYARVVAIVKSVMSSPSQLLEHVAGRIHRAILAEYPGVTSGTIKVTKIAPPIAAQLDSASFIVEF